MESERTVTAILQKLRVYHCDKGHVIRVRGTYTTLQLSIADETGRHYLNRDFNYCAECFGEWAVKQWPLTCVEIDAESAHG